MPYKIEPDGEKFKVVNTETGDVKGTHASRAKAEAQMRALYANEPDAKNADSFAFAGDYDEATKRGARNSLADAKRLQAAHDALVEAGAVCESVSKSMNLTYCKSISPLIEASQMAVKYVALDTIKGYTFLWGGENMTDIEAEYFTKSTDFWDDKLGKSPRPLTWDHAQDADFKASPVIGQITDWGDDEIGRWYEAKLDRAHKYRKAIDALIDKGILGTSSDSAPQYVRREKTGKSTWLKEWAWFASALTDTPAEPRMIGTLEHFKSLGVLLPDTGNANSWEWNKKRLRLLKLYNRSF